LSFYIINFNSLYYLRKIKKHVFIKNNFESLYVYADDEDDDDDDKE